MQVFVGNMFACILLMGFTTIAQIRIYIASFSNRPLQTKQVSECHGSGVLDPRVWKTIATMTACLQVTAKHI